MARAGQRAKSCPARASAAGATLSAQLDGWLGADRRTARGQRIRAGSGASMAEIVNLRLVRKRADRERAEARAAEARMQHGTPKRQREKAAAERSKAERTLDQHRIEGPGDRR
jgi:hypothetical protein